RPGGRARNCRSPSVRSSRRPTPWPGRRPSGSWVGCSRWPGPSSPGPGARRTPARSGCWRWPTPGTGTTEPCGRRRPRSPAVAGTPPRWWAVRRPWRRPCSTTTTWVSGCCPLVATTSSTTPSISVGTSSRWSRTRSRAATRPRRRPDMTTTLDELTALQQGWTTWHRAREAELAHDHGWLTTVALHWLPAAPAATGDLPGEFAAPGGGAGYDPAADGDWLLLTEAAPGGPAETVSGPITATIGEGESLLWLERGDVRLELLRRGGRVGVRVRDNQAPTRIGFRGVPAYSVDP